MPPNPQNPANIALFDGSKSMKKVRIKYYRYFRSHLCVRRFTGIETKFAGSSCNDVVTVENTVGVIFSGHFDKKIRMWDARTYKEQQGIEVQGKVTSLDISRGISVFLCTSISVSYETFSRRVE